METLPCNYEFNTGAKELMERMSGDLEIQLVREDNPNNIVELLLAYREECEGYAREGRLSEGVEFLNDHSPQLEMKEG